MLSIAEQPSLFHMQLLTQGGRLAGCREGRWYCENGLSRLVRWLARRDDQRRDSIGEAFIAALDTLENEQRGFSELEKWNSLGRRVIKQVKSESVQGEIARRLLALDYRSREEVEAKESPLFSQVKRAAKEWKAEQLHLESQALSTHDKEQLKTLAENYPELASLVMQHPELKQNCFEWVIQNKNLVAPFAEFPGTAELLKECYLPQRIGWLDKEALQIVREEGGKKTLTLPFIVEEEGELHSRSYSLLDRGRAVTFRGGLVCTVEEVFQEYRKKNLILGHFDFFKGGIDNWDLQLWGFRTRDAEGNEGCQLLDLDRENWWEEIPVMEELSLQEAQERYGEGIDGKSWAISVVATRRRLDLELDETHAHLEIAFPFEEEPGRLLYRILNPGKFIIENPVSFLTLLDLIGNSVQAFVASHDPNRVETGRQRTLFTEILEAAEGEWFLERELKPDIEESRKGNFAFQLFDHNCAEWVQRRMNELRDKLGKPRINFFKVKLLETRPSGLAGCLVKGARALPICLQNASLKALLLLFAPWRSMTIRVDGREEKICFLGSDSWNNLTAYCPSYLFFLQETLT